MKNRQDTQGIFIVYILNCSNGAYYTGYTTDLTRRWQEHQRGHRASKFTRSFKPLAIAQSWQVHGTKAHAMQVERHIKKLTKAMKTQLIQSPGRLATIFKEVCQVYVGCT